MKYSIGIIISEVEELRLERVSNLSEVTVVFHHISPLLFVS